MINALHSSDTPADSEREIEMIFPHILHGGENTEELERQAEGEKRRTNKPFDRELAIIILIFFHHVSGENGARDELGRSVQDEPRDSKDYLERYVCPTLVKGLSEMYETRPKSPISWLADWLTENNPYKEHVE